MVKSLALSAKTPVVALLIALSIVVVLESQFLVQKIRAAFFSTNKLAVAGTHTTLCALPSPDASAVLFVGCGGFF